MARGWYVIQVYTGYEKKVMNSILAKKNNGILANEVLDVRVPEEEYIIERRGKKVTKKRNMYPGYVLTELDISDDDAEWKRVYAEIKEINGVGMFLTAGGGNKRPAPLAYEDVKSIFEKTGEIKSSVSKLETGYQKGERVKIIEGAFKDFEGDIQDINTEKNNLVVGVEIFGRLTPVELDYGQIRKL